MKTRYIVALLAGLFLFLEIAGTQARTQQLMPPRIDSFKSSTSACVCIMDSKGRMAGASAEIADEVSDLRIVNEEIDWENRQLQQRNIELHQQQGQFVILKDPDGIEGMVCRITNRYELEICDKIAQNVWKDRKEDRK